MVLVICVHLPFCFLKTLRSPFPQSPGQSSTSLMKAMPSAKAGRVNANVTAAYPAVGPCSTKHSGGVGDFDENMTKRGERGGIVFRCTARALDDKATASDLLSLALGKTFPSEGLSLVNFSGASSSR